MISRPYIAYGSNMCRVQMAERCPGARLLGVTALLGKRFLINRAGYATLAAVPDAAAYGLIWALSAADERRLDDYEGVASGYYRKEMIALAEHGEALIYIAADATPGKPVPGYLEGMLAAAEAAALPLAYQAELARWR